MGPGKEEYRIRSVRKDLGTIKCGNKRRSVLTLEKPERKERGYCERGKRGAMHAAEN